MTTNAQREDFEKWCIDVGFTDADMFYYKDQNIYCDNAVNECWYGWQAALASTTPQGMGEEAIYGAVKKALNNYVLVNQISGDDSLPLVDVLTPSCDKTITRGQEKIDYLLDYICWEIKQALQSTAKPVVGEWSSIESAPKDGTQILVTWDDGCHWQYRIVFYKNRETEYVWQCVDNQLSMYPLNMFEYWQPILDPNH